jgi:N-acetylglucosaminyl-diphospho-decaprenol L-rhamnosyltransferase
VVDHLPDLSPSQARISAPVTVVVVNWNGGELLLRCLHSVQESRGCAAEIILIDNASTDGSAREAAQHIERLQLIQNSSNVGFARANNVGIQAAQTPYVLLLNNDTVLRPQALQTLIRYMQNHPDVAACGPRLVNADGSVQPFIYGSEPDIGHLVVRGLLALVGRSIHDWQVSTALDVDWVAGTAMLVRKAAIDAVGPLDEGFFMYFEDVDWCRRFRAGGWRVAYVPEAEVLHLNRRSYHDRERQQHYYRSLRRYYTLHYGLLSRLLLRLFLLPYTVLQRGRG